MDPFLKDNRHNYYNLSKKLLQVSGQWPYQKTKEKIIRTSVIVIWLATIFFVQVAQIFICETLPCIFQAIPMNLLLIVALVKLFTFHFNKQEMTNLIEHLHSDWDILYCEEEVVIMKKYAANGQRFTFIYFTCLSVITVVCGSVVLVPRILDVVLPLNESRPIILPCPAYYFVDETKYFYYMYLHQQLGAVVGISGLIAHDCNFFTLVEHVCCLFTITGFRFECLLYKRNITEKNLINSFDEIYFKNIGFSIQLHQRTLQFVSRLENVFSSSFAAQILIVVFVMTVSLIQISSELDGDVLEAMRYVVFVIGQVLHLLVLSFQGQKLINHSLQLQTKIYNGLWYTIPVRSQRLLLFTLGKSLKTSLLTAGKMYIFCLESFTSVMQCSVSYFTVLSSFNEP